MIDSFIEMRTKMRDDINTKTAMAMGKQPDDACEMQGDEPIDQSEKFDPDDVLPCTVNMCGSAGCIMVVCFVL